MNLMVILAGFAVAGILIFSVLRELVFKKFTSQKIFSDALNQIRNDTKLKEILGENIKGFGETVGRGRRRDVLRPLEYIVDGKKYMRLVFYVEGPISQGTVHLEAVESTFGGFEYRYLFVEVPGQGFPSRNRILIDNR
eukprot:Sdes_comp16060_c0_seq1m5265